MTLFATLPQVFQHTPALLDPLSWLTKILFVIKVLISVSGTFIIFVAAMLAFIRYACWRCRAVTQPSDLSRIRLDLGQSILLGLEFIVAADVIETTTAPDYYSVGILVIVVGIRTLLSMSLNREMVETQKSEAESVA